MSLPIKSNSTNENLLFKHNFIELTLKSKKNVINHIPSEERMMILNIIKENGNIILIKDKWDNFFERFKSVSELPIKLTRKEKSHSAIAIINTAIGSFTDNLAYCFNYLTANEANNLIKKAIINENLGPAIHPHVSKEQLKNLLMDARKQAINKEEPIDLANLLEAKGFSTEIRGVEFGTFSFKNTLIEEITFVDCKFNWTKFGNSSLTNVNFTHCEIFNLSLISSTATNCQFDNCEIRETMFNGSNFENVIFKNCDLISSSFEDASLKNCIFINSIMMGTHFFESSIEDCAIARSNLKNTVFFDSFPNFIVDEVSARTAVIDRPTTAIIVDPENVGITVPKAFLKLDRSSNVLPLRIAMKAQKTSEATVNREVQTALDIVGPYDPDQSPIPQRLIKELAKTPDSECALILKKAEKLAAHVNSIFLPGGEDVPPSLYGQKVEEKTEWGGDYRRSILELGLVHQSFNKGIPLMALCRGFQVANIYFGAQLVQDVGGQKGTQELKLSTPEKIGLYANVMKKSIVGACFHHQGVSVTQGPTEQLEAKVIYEGLIKAQELKDGGSVPMILLQFHPEFYQAKTAKNMQRELIDIGLNATMSSENEMFWKVLYDSAKSQEDKQKIGIQILSENPQEKLFSVDKRSVENKRAEATEGVIINYYKWKKELLDEVISDPEYFLQKYLSLPEQNDSFKDEREALEKALRYDDQFLKLIMGTSKDRVINIIQESRQDLYDELSESSLKPYIL